MSRATSICLTIAIRAPPRNAAASARQDLVSMAVGNTTPARASTPTIRMVPCAMTPTSSAGNGLYFVREWFPSRTPARPDSASTSGTASARNRTSRAGHQRQRTEDAAGEWRVDGLPESSTFAALAPLGGHRAHGVRRSAVLLLVSWRSRRSGWSGGDCSGSKQKRSSVAVRELAGARRGLMRVRAPRLVSIDARWASVAPDPVASMAFLVDEVAARHHRVSDALQEMAPCSAPDARQRRWHEVTRRSRWTAPGEALVEALRGPKFGGVDSCP